MRNLKEKVEEGVISLQNMSIPKLQELLETLEDYWDREMVNCEIFYRWEPEE